MSGWIGLVIALVYLAVHVGSIIAKEAQKRKERERLMEQAERRRMTEARLEMPGSADEAQLAQPAQWQSRSATRAPAPPPSPRDSRSIDDLAARRKQQLEQLRNRPVRQPGRPPQTIPGRPVPPQPPRSGPLQPQVLTQGRVESDRDRMLREQQPTSHQKAAMAKAQKLQQSRRDAARQRRADFESLVNTSDAVIDHAAPITHARPASAIMRRLQDRTALREIFILKEVIDPPVALRTDQPA